MSSKKIYDISWAMCETSLRIIRSSLLVGLFFLGIFCSSLFTCSTIYLCFLALYRSLHLVRWFVFLNYNLESISTLSLVQRGDRHVGENRNVHLRTDSNSERRVWEEWTRRRTREIIFVLVLIVLYRERGIDIDKYH